MWIPLVDVDPDQPARYGNKACALARCAAAGLPVPPSWVLPTEAVRDLDATAAAAALRRRDPGVRRWMLRSSSPWEDRPDASGAGLLTSVDRRARSPDLAEGLAAVRASAAEPAARALLGGEAPLAVLAQPYLDRDLWLTVELGPGRVRWEGWRRRRDGTRRLLERDGPWPAPPRAGLETIHRLLERLYDPAAAPVLLELGRTGEDAVLLQRRPAPRRAPAPRPADEPAEEPAPFPLFADDEDHEWALDAEHCPTPLCPLLVGHFAVWLRRQGPDHPSRLIQGRWHDRLDPPPPPLAVEDAEEELRRALREWEEIHRPGLKEGLARLEARRDGFPAFLERWLDWQESYFDGLSSRLRRAADPLLAERRAAGLPPPPLPPTAASRRRRDLAALARRLQDPQTSEAERARAFEDFLARHGHHAPGLFDGRAVPWREDPAPLRRQLERPPSALEPPDRGAAAAEEGPLRRRGVLAGKALAALEDDDDLLGRAYALWRRAVLEREKGLAPPGAAAEILDLTPAQLADLGDDPTPRDWRQAVRRGRARLALWLDAAAAGAGAVAAGESRRGRPLSPGRAEGPVRRLATAQDEGGPAAGEVLVVSTLLPADAVVFPRAVALVVESGALLGHAAVLAREHGLPAVVLPRARALLARARRVLVDGDQGLITVRETEE